MACWEYGAVPELRPDLIVPPAGQEQAGYGISWDLLVTADTSMSDGKTSVPGTLNSMRKCGKV